MFSSPRRLVVAAVALSIWVQSFSALAQGTNIADELISYVTRNNPTEDKSVLPISAINIHCSDLRGVFGDDENVLDDVAIVQERFRDIDLEELESLVGRASDTAYRDVTEEVFDIFTALQYRTIANANSWLASDGEGVDCTPNDFTFGELHSGSWAFFNDKISLWRAQLEALLIRNCGEGWSSSCLNGEHYTAAHLLISRKIALYCSLLDRYEMEYTSCRSMLRDFESSRIALKHFTAKLELQTERTVQKLRELYDALGHRTCDEAACDSETDFFARWASAFAILAHQDSGLVEKLQAVDFEFAGETRLHKDARFVGLTLSDRPYINVWTGKGPDAVKMALSLYSD